MPARSRGLGLAAMVLAGLTIMAGMVSDANAQIKEFHKLYLCDDQGSLDGVRIQYTLDFAMCKTTHGEEDYCSKCRCAFVKYYKAASACFSADPDYESRVLATKESWEADYIEFCLEGDTSGLLEFSLDPTSDAYCNGSSRGLTPFIPLPLVASLSLIFAIFWS